MTTMTTSATTTVRLPDPIRSRLEYVARATKRTRSSLMIEALEAHLERLQGEALPAETQTPRYAGLLKYRGAAARAGGRSAKEISAILRDIRGDD
jgi:predicted transcriptional regulator